MDRTRACFLVLGLVVLANLPAGRALADKDEPKKDKPKFTIGKETTFVTGPLDKDGYIDYAAALNKEMGKGITPRSNANVLLWKALGPHPEGTTMPAEFFKLLGIDSPPERGDYFIGLSRYVSEHLKLEGDEKTDVLVHQEFRAIRRAWTAKELPHIAGWLMANEKPLALVVEATRLPDYFNPLVPVRTGKESAGLLSARLPGAQTCRGLANALAARALLHAGEGRADETWQDLLACHRLGLLVGRGGTLIESLVGIAIGQIASTADIAFLDRVRLTAKQVQSCLRDLQQLPAPISPADKVALGERCFLLEIVTMVDRHGIDYLENMAAKPPRGDTDPRMKQMMKGVDWDPALRNVNRWFDRIAAALRIKDRPARQKQLNELERDLRALKKNATESGALIKLFGTDKPEKVIGKGIGDILIGLMLPAFNKIQQAEDRGEQIRANLHVAFALAVYQRDHRAYPKGLAELAPKYLTQVPGDLFSGKALIYRPGEKGYLLYSVGPNGKDDGGRWYDDDPPGDDPRVRIPLPELKRNK